MASGAADSPPPPPKGLRMESIGTIDLRHLSQSELYDLSLCSEAAMDLRLCEDIVIPKIDRSVFNESAASRRQTYSRLRLAPQNPGSSIAAVPTGSTASSPTPQVRDDPEGEQDSRVIGLFKELLNGRDSIPVRVEFNGSVGQLQNVPNVVNSVTKRGRGRPRKNENRLAVVRPVFKVASAEVKVDKKDAAIVITMQNVVNVEKRGRGRPRKHENRLVAVEAKVDKKETVSVINGKRGRGRPRKNENRLAMVAQVGKMVEPLAQVDMKEAHSVINVPHVVNVGKKRGRGRPRKYLVVQEVDKKEAASVINVPNVIKRGRGRPRKTENRLVLFTQVVNVVETPAEAKLDKNETAREDIVVDANVVNRDGSTVNMGVKEDN
ncbi:methyl-CpG-binding domain-containing protein 8-like [Impatiens glandulifera]|uniref:methyl-CpG-binding domain-containing protein 8-like n=1 Tax=Impatiens glandulifera TaxID=253017 RepID=UPI001FB1074C|nr:methyl-CpG-binding domain-containing protein 8-like [Impatiens glandulifera]XP_047329965.1 methyl-CpG-binding domain-containing protein 8-like [Impatiens glandulifera]XP_047329967.1 methyl-CpG-binding domain-containing protein 8-like [Impatiens glandulifera]XP_047329968.1 methyl-CpG-binding domain-containing protein 8-like [Impatiens glandulifera]